MSQTGITPLKPLTGSFDENGQPLSTPQDWALNYQLPSDIEQPLTGARPASQTAAPFATQPVTSASTPTNTASATTPTSSASIWDDIKAAFSGQFGSIPGVVDVVAILAGLVLLIGAVFGFKNVANTTVDVVRGTAETVSRIAEA